MTPQLVLATLALAAAEPPRQNPLLATWDAPFGLPPWSQLRDDDFLPALDEAMAAERREIDAIAAAPGPATFQNTVEALDASGSSLRRVEAVYQHLLGADTRPSLQAIDRVAAPRLAGHRDAIALHEGLFRRVKAVWEQRDRLGLADDQRALLDRTWKRFVRGGAELPPAGRERLRAIHQELATLGVKFGDNLLAETNAFRLVLDRPAQLDGLSPQVVASAAQAARAAGLEGKWLFTLHAPSLWPFMQQASDRELRRRMFEAYTTRCDHGGPTDNKALVARMAALRAEKARLLGYATWADFVLDDAMAGTTARAYGLMRQLWEPARQLAQREADSLRQAIRADGRDHPLEPWDWFYYTEKVRKARYDLADQELRPYFPLDQVREGAFWVASRLYGITFTPLPGLPLYHPEARAFEVKDADGSHLAVFVTDYHPRPGKRSGAWATGWRGQYVRDGKAVRPLVVNVCNFTRPAGDAPALLSLEEVETLFHEFGHALHAMLGAKRYESLGQVPRDFVELPSQVMENWATSPEVLRHYARHWKTGEPIPAALVERMERARRFDQGFINVEYLAAALLDLEWHTLTAAAEPDTAALERIAMARIGMPGYIVPRYRSTYFQHAFGPGGGYAAAYYSYRWAAVLDADAFAAFEEKGLFDRATADAFRREVLEKGRADDQMKLYVRFRGREPSVEPLLRRLGLAGPEAQRSP